MSYVKQEGSSPSLIKNQCMSSQLEKSYLNLESTEEK